MAVEMNDDDFGVVHEALRKVNTVFGEDDIAEILKGERAAWKVMDRVASEVGLSSPGGPLLPRST
jgi:hypothetical protein